MFPVRMIAMLPDKTSRIVQIQIEALTDEHAHHYDTDKWIKLLGGATLRPALAKDEYEHARGRPCNWCRRDVSLMAASRVPGMDPHHVGQFSYCCADCMDRDTPQRDLSDRFS